MKRRRMEEVREGEVQTEQARRSLRRRVDEGRNREEQEGDEKRKIGKRSGKMKKKKKRMHNAFLFFFRSTPAARQCRFRGDPTSQLADSTQKMH